MEQTHPAIGDTAASQQPVRQHSDHMTDLSKPPATAMGARSFGQPISLTAANAIGPNDQGHKAEASDGGTTAAPQADGHGSHSSAVPSLICDEEMGHIPEAVKGDPAPVVNDGMAALLAVMENRAGYGKQRTSPFVSQKQSKIPTGVDPKVKRQLSNEAKWQYRNKYKLAKRINIKKMPASKMTPRPNVKMVLALSLFSY